MSELHFPTPTASRFFVAEATSLREEEIRKTFNPRFSLTSSQPSPDFVLAPVFARSAHFQKSFASRRDGRKSIIVRRSRLVTPRENYTLVFANCICALHSYMATERDRENPTENINSTANVFLRRTAFLELTQREKKYSESGLNWIMRLSFIFVSSICHSSEKVAL